VLPKKFKNAAVAAELYSPEEWHAGGDYWAFFRNS
jgi:hypothetical protein